MPQGIKTQEVVNAEVASDIKYIRVTLDEVAGSMKDIRKSLQNTSTMAFETKLKVNEIEKDLADKVDKNDHKALSDRLTRVEKIIFGFIGLILVVVIGALLRQVIISS